MSKRLQVILDDQEMKEVSALARASRMTVSAWVRNALREARKHAPRATGDRKLKVVRMAARNSFPSADIDTMLAQIESGYHAGTS